MTAGLETYTATGQLSMSVTDSITRVLGTYETGTADGSIEVPGFAGVPYERRFCTTLNFTNGGTSGQYLPVVRFTPTGLAWTFRSNWYNAKDSGQLLFGVF